MNAGRSGAGGWRVAILGATGAVGRSMLSCLESSALPVRELHPLASPRSAGQEVLFRGSSLRVRAVAEDSFAGVDLALFSAGATASGDWAPNAIAHGAWVVDNSSRWRMDPTVPLVVPEVNAHALPSSPGLVANPNCSTIQLVVALEPLRRHFGLRSVVVSTYQSASGKGQTGLGALADERTLGASRAPVFPGRLLGNVLPQCDVFLDDGFTREEEKLIQESRKILALPELAVHPTCVRVPVDVAHAESVYVETERPVTTASARAVLADGSGIRLCDDPERGLFPTPLDAAGTDPVWVGRVRADRQNPCGLHLFVVADNLRKGAALNAVQIAEILWRREQGAA